MIIKEYKIGEHCFGPILEVNGKDYEDLDKKEVRKFINHMMENDINSELLTREIFSTCLEYLQYDVDEDESYDSYTCDQCFNINWSTKYINNEEDNDNTEGT